MSPIHKFSSALLSLLMATSVLAQKQPVKAIYIPLADHYPAVVAYEKYREQMTEADFSIEKMKSWRLLRSYFRSGDVDMAFIMSPMAMDMFAQKQDFRWVSLIHRDGNALAINDLLNEYVRLPPGRMDRKPDAGVAEAIRQLGHPIKVGVPSLLATHTVVLYKYMKDHGLKLGIGEESAGDAVAIAVPPPKSPAFIKGQNSRGNPAAFEQSLPWADVVETGGYGKVAWYSKDVLPWPKGHVECIVIVTDQAIRTKRKAIQEVIDYLHLAGRALDHASAAGGQELRDMGAVIRKHIPEHNLEAIVQSLRSDLGVINYHDLNVDVGGMKQVMDLAVEAGVIRETIDLSKFADRSFESQPKDDSHPEASK